MNGIEFHLIPIPIIEFKKLLLGGHIWPGLSSLFGVEQIFRVVTMKIQNVIFPVCRFRRGHTLREGRDGLVVTEPI